MSNLQNTINDLATQLASDILNALQGASLADLGEMLDNSGGARVKPRELASSTDTKTLKPRKSGKGSGVKRSPEAIQAVLDSVVRYLNSNSEGIGSEHLQKALGIEKKDIVGPITQALAQGLIKKSGQKRATRYFPGSGRAATKAPKAAAAKKVGKKAKAVKAKPKAVAKAKSPAKKAKPRKSSKSANGIAGAATPVASSPDVTAEA